MVHNKIATVQDYYNCVFHHSGLQSAERLGVCLFGFVVIAPLGVTT